MSFFGFDTSLNKPTISQEEDLAVYTFGEESYDGLADALEEGLDELNDETFGDIADLPADEFDFGAAQKLPGDDLPPKQLVASGVHPSSHPPQAAQEFSLEALWSNQPTQFTTPEGYQGNRVALPSQANHKFIPFEEHSSPSHHPSRARTLAEVEAEQRAAAQLARLAISSSPSLQSPSLSQLPPQAGEYRSSPLIHHASPDLSQMSGADLERELFLRRQQELQAQQQSIQQQQRLELLRQQQQQHIQYQRQQEQEILLQQQRQMQQQRLLQQQLHSAQMGLPPPRTPILQQQQQLQRFGSPHPSPIPMSNSPHHQIIRHPILDEIDAIDPQSITEDERVSMRAAATQRILEAERIEAKRKRRMMKIASMSKYNDIMTQSDKDFITRIQVSQLVTQDPYTEDFYAQIFVAVHGPPNRGGNGNGHVRNASSVVSFGKGGGLSLTAGGGPGPTESGRRGVRKESALQRLQNQVERIVNNAKSREATASSVHLQGALGKVSGRSYKAAPRQALQVGAAVSSVEQRQDAAKLAAKQGRDALAGAAGELVRQQPLTKRQTLIVIESLYDTLLTVEQLRRDQPPQEQTEASDRWTERYSTLVDKLWTDSKIMAPLETSDPHPFISLIAPNKGKHIVPRLLRHIDTKRVDLFFTLLIACYSQLDVVRDAHYLDVLDEAQPQNLSAIGMQKQVQQSHDVFFKVLFPVLARRAERGSLLFVTGMLGLLLESSNIVGLAQTRAGLAVIQIFLSRALKLTRDTPPDSPEVPSQDEVGHWQIMFEHLVQFLLGNFDSLFPSSRIAATLPPSAAIYIQNAISVDVADTPVWTFLGSLALLASNTPELHAAFVAELKDKILGTVLVARAGPGNGMAWIDGQGELKLSNVDRFLNAVNLDSSQIQV